MSDRIQWNADILDEIVATDVKAVHLEAMGWHGWWGRIDLNGGGSITLAMSDVTITETEEPTPLATDGGPLTYWCDGRWQDRDYRDHRCEIAKSHTRHRCECGATKAAS